MEVLPPETSPSSLSPRNTVNTLSLSLALTLEPPVPVSLSDTQRYKADFCPSSAADVLHDSSLSQSINARFFYHVTWGPTAEEDYASFKEKAGRTVYFDNLSPLVTESVLRTCSRSVCNCKECEVHSELHWTKEYCTVCIRLN
ncbi:RNA recognition motif domain [Quillaja saponaria]|uniref:RNA recognition motif domain n=1 Tax=Quillaja saponaria TaxID=32244 RepID=A0AAD7PCU4_QUISA|nr:RNA recognition motif domain [Quillaja saponaria]